MVVPQIQYLDFLTGLSNIKMRHGLVHENRRWVKVGGVVITDGTKKIFPNLW